MLHAVIMAGGSGTRFWPASRSHRPKQLLAISGEQPLLRRTWERLEGWVPPERVWVVTTAGLVSEVSRLLPEIPATNILGEPAGRDTAACAGYAAARLLTEDSEAVCLVLPADHVIGDHEAFRTAMLAGVDHVNSHGGLLTFGVRPTRPETGYGYLQLGDAAPTGTSRVHRLQRFVEKPDIETARRYLDDGGYLWNAGIFAWRAADILSEIRRQLPELAAGLGRLSAAFGTPQERATIQEIYPTLPRTSVDFGIMEHAGTVWCVPVKFPWSDVGSWGEAWEIAAKDPSGNATSGRVITIDSEGSLVSTDGPAVAVVGGHDLIVVATRDAVLVLPRDQAQRVKEVVQDLERRGWGDLL